MKCEQVKELLALYISDDLSMEVGRAVKTHLDECDSCQASAQEIEQTLDLLRDALAATSEPDMKLSDSAKKKIFAAEEMPVKENIIQGWLFNRHPWLVPAAAAVIVCGFVLFGINSMVAPYCAKSSIANESLHIMLHDASEVDGVYDVAEDEEPYKVKKSAPSPKVMPSSAGLVAREELAMDQASRSASISDDRFDYVGVLAPVPDPVEIDFVTEAQLSVDISPRPAKMDSVSSIKSPVKVASPYANRFGGSEKKKVSPSSFSSGSSVKYDASKDVNGDNSPMKMRGIFGGRVAGHVGAFRGKVKKEAASGFGADDLDIEISVTEEAVAREKSKDNKSMKSTVSYGWGGGKKRDQADKVVRNERIYRSKPQDYTLNGAVAARNRAEDVLYEAEERICSIASELSEAPEVYKLSEASELFEAMDDEAEEMFMEEDEEDYMEEDEEDYMEEAEEESCERLLAQTVKVKIAAVNPFVSVAKSPFSTFAIDVDTASYTLARNYLNRGQRPPAELVRTEEFVNFFDYDYRPPERDLFRVVTEVAPSKFGHGLQLMKIGVKGKRLGREEQRQAVLTFLVDTSGSMNKTDRIGLIKKSLSMLVRKLAPHDQVAIVQYGSDARILLEHTVASEQKKILAVIDAMQCNGSTNLEKGMHRAYQLAASAFIGGGENKVLLLSDGVATLGADSAKDILEDVAGYKKQGITCSVFGFGMATYDDAMLEQLANKGDGAYIFIDSEDEARRVFVDDLAATLNTIATDVKIQVEFKKDQVVQYRQLGYENRQLKKEDFRNNAIDAGEVGSGQSVTALYELDMNQSFVVPQSSRRRGKRAPAVVAIVRVRYRRVDSGKVEEIEHVVTERDLLGSFDKASARFRLAACVAETAEILRGSSFANGSELKDVAKELRPVALDLHLDKRVQELLRIVNN